MCSRICRYSLYRTVSAPALGQDALVAIRSLRHSSEHFLQKQQSVASRFFLLQALALTSRREGQRRKSTPAAAVPRTHTLRNCSTTAPPSAASSDSSSPSSPEAPHPLANPSLVIQFASTDSCQLDCSTTPPARRLRRDTSAPLSTRRSTQPPQLKPLRDSSPSTPIAALNHPSHISFHLAVPCVHVLLPGMTVLSPATASR